MISYKKSIIDKDIRVRIIIASHYLVLTPSPVNSILVFSPRPTLSVLETSISKAAVVHQRMIDLASTN